MKSSRFAWTIRPPRRQRRRSDSSVGIRSLIKRIGPRRLATLGRDRILEIHRNQAGMNHQVSGVRRASSMISLRKLKIAGVILVVSLLGLSANSAQAQNAPAAQTDPADAAPAADAPTKPAPADVPVFHTARPHHPLPESRGGPGGGRPHQASAGGCSGLHGSTPAQAAARNSEPIAVPRRRDAEYLRA